MQKDIGALEPESRTKGERILGGIRSEFCNTTLIGGVSHRAHGTVAHVDHPVIQELRELRVILKGC